MNGLIFFSLLLMWHYSTGIYLTNSTVKSQNDDNPAVWTETGMWGTILEDYVLGNKRQSKVMQFIPVQIVPDFNETKPEVTKEEKESKISPGTKIVNTGNNPLKRPPPRQVTETDMYLLGAIEKLVYKVDFMEKRLRRVEEMLYFVMAGNKMDQEPCPDNFFRAGLNCYLFAGSAGRELDWKAANKQCKRYGAILAEMETIEENQDIISYIQSKEHLRGKDFWTGGLNPGLLWIWGNSARPVKIPGNKETESTPIQGGGRCLRLAYNPALRSYSYRGTDCASRYSIICELQENTASNELNKLGRSRKILDEL